MELPLSKGSRFSADNLPPGLSLGQGTGLITGRPESPGTTTANLSPMQRDSTQAYSVGLLESGGNQYLSLSYRLHRRATDVRIIIRRAASLDHPVWTEEGIVPVSIVPLNADTDLVTVRSTAPVAEHNSQFFQFMVERRP
jgi:hypothetical protein